MVGKACRLLFLWTLLLLGTAAGDEAEEAASTSCSALGFTGLSLCSDCDHLLEYVKDEELYQDCKQCCAEETKEASIEKFSSARLEVDEVRLTYYRNVKRFIDKEASSFGDLLRVKYKTRSPPKLILYDADNEKNKISVRIDNWKTEHIKEYLEDKLLRAGAS